MPPSPFDEPEVAELLGTLLGTLLQESDRGAILIGAAHVDNHLRALFDAVLPAAHGKQKRASLLNYPGPLGTFAARVELAYGLRLIPRITYDALQALRKIRNDLAHSPESFQIRDHAEQLRRIYVLGPEMPAGIRRLALEVMFDYKWQVAQDVVRKSAAEDPEMQPILQTKHDFAEYVSSHPDVLEALETQLPRWELVFGISLLCGMIVFHREKTRSVLGTEATLGNVLKLGRDADT